MFKRISLIFLLLHGTFIHLSVAQDTNIKELVISANTGISFLATELYGDLSGRVNEFNNQPGLLASFELSRFFFDRLEAGGGIIYSGLRGKSDNPGFSAIGYQYYINEPFNRPVRYTNLLYGPQVFVRYHFRRSSLAAQNLTWFLKAGTGILYYKSELFYSDMGKEVIFGKNTGAFKTYRNSNMVYIVGGGISYAVSEIISLKAAADMSMVGYDFLDVVHNFDDAGNRRSILGVVTAFSVGVSIHLKHQKVLNLESVLPFSP